MSGIEELKSKLRDRIRDKKDLALVSSCLKSFSGYLYTRIPELSDSFGDSIQKMEQDTLLEFVNKINDMTAYRSEPSKPKSEGVALVKEKADSLVMRAFGNETLAVRYFSWWIVLQILASVSIAV